MADFGTELKKVFLAGVGAIAMTAEKSKELVDELVEKGELTVEQGKVLNEELKRDVSSKVKEAVSNIQPSESVEKIAARVDKMSAEERELLMKKLMEAEAEKDEKNPIEATDEEKSSDILENRME